MAIQNNDIQVSGIDTKALSNLIIELNIARRNSRAYPKDHPAIGSSLLKALASYEGLMNMREEIVLGVTSDALMVAGVFLEKSNLVYRDFAHVLFERGIGALVLRNGLDIEELKNFTVILGLKREDILHQGGIEEVWTKAGIVSLSVRPIRYDLFSTTDEESIGDVPHKPSMEGLWERFARGLSQGGLGHDGSAENNLDPEILASILNRQSAQGATHETSYSAAIIDFMRQDDGTQTSGAGSNLPYDKLAVFISNLNPDLRRQFLSSSFDIRNVPNRSALEGIANNLSEEAVIETLEDISLNQLSLPPVIIGLLQRLSRHASTGRQGTNADISSEKDLFQKMKTIFREHATEEFIPDAYQSKLNHLITADTIPHMPTEDINILLETLDNGHIERRIGEILVNLVKESSDDTQEREMLTQNLSDMFAYFLETGDYRQMHRMMNQIEDDSLPVDMQDNLREQYIRHEILEEILNGLTIWGKPRFDEIRMIILKIGTPFIEVLLDRLSEEKNMSLRRFYMDCLIAMGPVTVVPISNRLNDHRWYFLRNLLIILTAQNDPSIVPLIRPLLRNTDKRLRQEVLKTLVFFQDPEAEKQILQELDSQENEKLLAAIQLTEKCQSPDILNKLLDLLAAGGLKQPEYEIKSAVVHSLGEIGRIEALPGLVKILVSTSLFHSKLLISLKTDVVRSLERYPSSSVKPLLERLASGNYEVTHQALESLRNISGKSA